MLKQGPGDEMNLFSYSSISDILFQQKRKKFNIRWLESELNTKEPFPALEKEEKDFLSQQQ